MMTSVVTDAARGNRDRALPQTTHTSQPQKPIQATAEQIRLAQMIYDKNDADFEGKVQQLMEVTGKNQDECMVALHDCNGDVNRAINFLLEEITVKDSWETVGKKKNVGKEGTAPESREKRGEREGRGRGGPNRRGRGASHNQEGRSEENGFDSAPGERGGDRGRRGRGRGVGSRGRGRGAGMSRFSQGMGRTFNPADCTGSAEAGEAGNETTEGAGAWKDSLEDWAAEDWNEDLSETKVFTASYALGSKNLAQPGQGMDLGSLLSKVAEGDSELAGLEPSCPDTLTQSLVFTNSQQHTTRTHTHSYASAAAGTYAHAASSMLGSRLPQYDVQKMEPISTPRIAPLSNQVSGALSNGTASVESTAPVPLETTPVTLNEHKETPVTTTHLDLKPQPDPSPILGRLTQHQNAALQSDLPAQARDPAPLPPHDGPSPTLKPLCEPVITTTEPPQPRTIRPQRRRAPPPSKIPSSAVEMPGSADVSGLNVQFGALDFGSESTVENLNQSESSCQEPEAAPQTQSSLYFKSTAISESLGGLPQAVMESSYPSASLVLPSTTAPPVLAPSSASRVESSATTPQNGFSEMRTSSAQEAAPSSTPQPVSTALSTENGLSSSSLSSSSSSTAAPVLSTALPSLSSHVSSVNSPGSSAPTSSSLSMGADVNVSLSTYSGSVSSVSSSTVNSNGLSAANQSLTANGASAPSAVRSAPLQTNITPSNTSGKAPPNLAQGVPPLLASQYIMGPGGFLPAYPPIYGYEDLQMMQSRLPMDYYGMTYPGTALAGRDGGLANNPYTGEPTKFGRSDSNSPAPATSLSSVPPSQSQQSAVPPHNQGPQNPGQAQQGQTQAFLNPPLPPGYGYTSLPYYPGVPGMPSAFQYGPTVFMPPASTKQHNMGLSSQYQHQAGYSQHMYGPGYDELSQAHAGGDYGKGGYGGSSQSQAKAVSNSSGKAPGLPGSASSELTGTVYSKTQSFDKQGFPTAAGPAFSLPSALGGTGPLNPAGAPGYAPAPFLHILPHQQPPSQLLHHHMAQDTQGQRSQANSMQKGQGKSNYSSSPYWAN
ncbi:ubiquitin-associated protein 2-like isoform X4 [Sinocyclocheilus rhinocerous]|uniref:ubiquitin-associated protein 2-like isoform X4 n=1 Tax=Sinocyclocheilus rhinocerous TaxID=307959 RepID=UPI0007B7CB04|nr:PREDICTED: ubiquitin-associated protein 2-like isoform X4 [Sinocyclocheilus rhinocerous]